MYNEGGYGMTETASSAYCHKSSTQTYSGTIGVAIPSTQMRCMEDDGKGVPLGQPGEIASKGPQVMAG